MISSYPIKQESIFKHIYLNLKNSTTKGQSRPGSSSSLGVLHTPHIFRTRP